MSFIIQEQAAPSILEIGTQTAAGAGGEFQFLFGDQDQFLFLGDASADFSFNLTYDAGTTLDDALNVDDVIRAKIRVTQGSTPFSFTGLTIDGTTDGVTYAYANSEFLPITGTTGTISEFNFEVTKISGGEFEVFVGTGDEYSELYLPPDPPTIGSATSVGTGSAASVPFTPTTFTGSPFGVSYTIVSSPSSITATGSSSPIQIGGLTKNATYTFQAFASTPVADSILSATSNPVVIALDFPPTIELLAVGGGGGGAQGDVAEVGGGGGGAGGYRTDAAFAITDSTPYTITVGAGGNGVADGSGGSAAAGSGTASSFGSFSSAGGGGSANYLGTPSNGGSGAGGTYTNGFGLGNTPNVSPSQGNNGAAGNSSANYAGGGGGGASQAGFTGSTFNGGDGGDGTASSITGSSVTRGGGGGGGITRFGVAGGIGGLGGGGDGGTQSTNGTNGSPNTGGGGGGGGRDSSGANGGSGIVIIAYPTSKIDATIGAGLTYTFDNGVSRPGFKVYTFTAGSGTIQWG